MSDIYHIASALCAHAGINADDVQFVRFEQRVGELARLTVEMVMLNEGRLVLDEDGQPGVKSATFEWREIESAKAARIDEAAWRRSIFDASRWVEEQMTQRPDCPTCGGHERTGLLEGFYCPDCVDGKVPIERLVASGREVVKRIAVYALCGLCYGTLVALAIWANIALIRWASR